MGPGRRAQDLFRLTAAPPVQHHLHLDIDPRCRNRTLQKSGLIHVPSLYEYNSALTTARTGLPCSAASARHTLYDVSGGGTGISSSDIRSNRVQQLLSRSVAYRGELCYLRKPRYGLLSYFQALATLKVCLCYLGRQRHRCFLRRTEL